jgi:flavorubredoxin
MAIIDAASGTTVDEVGPDLYRISTPVRSGGFHFTFNRYLLLDDEPLLFHTGPRKMATLTIAAVATVVPLSKLRWISFGHVEADECGALNEILAAAERATPLCGSVAARVSVHDIADRPPRGLDDGEQLVTGRRTLSWIAAPHVPHAWENGFLFDSTSRTLLCGDLFTQGGADHDPITDTDVLAPSEAFRRQADYFAQAPNTRASIERLSALAPTTLACMHGSAWRGDGAKLLGELAIRLDATATGSSTR